MIKKILPIVLLLFCSLLQAEPKGYEIISPAQPTQHPDKIEVIEFFGTVAHIVTALSRYSTNGQRIYLKMLNLSANLLHLMSFGASMPKPITQLKH